MEWLEIAKAERQILDASLNYWKEDVKDLVHYTDEEKMIFVLMDCLARAKEFWRKEIEDVVNTGV